MLRLTLELVLELVLRLVLELPSKSMRVKVNKCSGILDVGLWLRFCKYLSLTEVRKY
jgi:hypothetical protein